MKNKPVLLFAVLMGSIAIIFVVSQSANRTKTNSQIQGKNNSSISYQTLTDEKGDVIVEALPTKLSSKENSELNIKLTTHSVDLNYDFKNIAILSDDRGNQYKPLSWTGGKGGHHIEGALVFPSFSNDAKSVELIIKQIGGVDRVFKWNL